MGHGAILNHLSLEVYKNLRTDLPTTKIPEASEYRLRGKWVPCGGGSRRRGTSCWGQHQQRQEHCAWVSLMLLIPQNHVIRRVDLGHGYCHSDFAGQKNKQLPVRAGKILLPLAFQAY